MSNSFFKFKQFTIHQDQCAMKVCTDACLFGAWVARMFELNQPQRILDIGTGTGLLTLMLAQKLTAAIASIEIDRNAYLQAVENISKTKWLERIDVINADVKEYYFDPSFDLIISNPPFYENDLRSPDAVSNMAKHDETLTLDSLLPIVKLTLAATGSFALLIPGHRLTYCVATAENYELFPEKIVQVRQSTHHGYFRSMVVFKKRFSNDVEEKELSIKEGTDYSDEFIELLQDYYLYL